MMQIRLQLHSDLIAEEPDLNPHARGSQRGDSLTCDPPIRVVHADDNPRDAGGQDRVDARRGSPVVRARFQRHHQGCTRRGGASCCDGNHLGMSASWWLGGADTDDTSGRVKHDCTDPRVR